jgi:NADH dehydrogenase
MWRATYLYKLPGLEQKAKVFFEWNLELLFPRDISLLDIKTTNVVGRVHLEKGDPVYHIGDTAFSFYLLEKGKIVIDDHAGAARTLIPGEHFGERELLENTKRKFDASAVESSTLLALDKVTFEALTKNSLTLGYFLNRSSVRYLTLQERKAIVDRASPSLLQKRVKDFMQTGTAVLRETDSIRSALQAFKQANAGLLPVVDANMVCKSWLRLDFAIDWLHQGKARLESTVSDLRTLPCVTMRPDDSIEQALLQFAQTPDRVAVIANDGGQFIGTLSVVDLILADGPTQV